MAKKRYADKLMMSEWMEEVPLDLDAKWLFVPCPTGKRCLLITEKVSLKKKHFTRYL